MSDVVFALRRNASTDPPEPARECETSHGVGVWYAVKGRWYRTDGFTVMDPQPSCWYDLRPSDEPLTTDDLRNAAIAVRRSRALGSTELSARLRAALDALAVSTGRMGEPPKEGT